MDVLLDISRTVARARLAQPTGIDRVERAYIDWAIRGHAGFLCRVGRRLYVLDDTAVLGLIDWLDGQAAAPTLDLRGRLAWRSDPRLARAHAHVRRYGRPVRLRHLHPDTAGVYLNVGHDNLDVQTMRTLGKVGWRRVVLIHDTIPLDYPEYTAPGIPARFRAKLEAASLADAIICNSADTGQQLRSHLTRRRPRIVTAPLGVHKPAEVPRTEGPPAFVVLGTIEPRKNHRLLLEMWARFWAARGTASPHLTIIGRRGWENHAVFRMLDAHPMIGQTVHEFGALDTGEVAAHLRGARALLFPSFAEGYGLPLAEALALGTPAVCSDLPALREVGGAVPEWLAPTDEAGWTTTVSDYANAASPRRASQLFRLESWTRPIWGHHFARVENLLETILVQPPRGG